MRIGGILAIVVTIALLSISLMPSASAQIEFTSGVLAFRRCDSVDPLVGCWDTSLPYDPRVACSPDNSECLLVIYDDDSSKRGLHLKYSWGVNGRHYENLAYGCANVWDEVFGGCREVGFISTDMSSFVRGYFDNYHLPYDVTYYDGAFYIVHKNVVYKFDGTLSTYMNIPSVYGSNRWGVHFVDQTRIDPPVILAFESKYGASGNSFSSLKVTELEGYMCVKANWGGTGYLYKNFHYLTNGSSTGSDIIVCPTVADTWCTDCDGSFPYSYTGLDYRSWNDVFYQRFGNTTWKAVTSDFSTFSSNTLYYAWDNTLAENLSMSDGYLNERNKLIAYEREVNDTTIDGVYVYNEKYYPFKILARGLNMNTLASEDISVTATITCLSANYSYTASGVNPVVTTPCLTGNAIMITASGWQPTTVTMTNISVLSPNGYTYISSPSNNLGWVNEYNFTIRVFDSFSGEPVDGASVTVGSETKTTDSTGSAVFSLTPYGSATFVLTNTSTTYYLSLHGTPADYFADISKDGYISDTISFKLTEKSDPTGVSDFKRSENVQFDPIHARVLVDVYWKDGVHYEGDTVVVRIGGAQNGTYLDDDGILLDRNYATDFPAVFVLLDDRASWTANINLTSASEFQSDTISITNTTYVYTYDFYLSNTSANQECNTDLGCSATFCKGNVWYYNGRCENGVCVYDLESCVLCDDEGGCYVETTDEECPTGLDSECYDSNYCIDSKHLASYKCSSDKICIMDIVECEYMCDEDEGVCVGEVEVACDQSTVTGMLYCTQAGLLSFIGATYDPMFVLLVALFIAFLLVGLLALAFKGIISVLR